MYQIQYLYMIEIIIFIIFKNIYINQDFYPYRIKNINLIIHNLCKIENIDSYIK